MKLKNNILIVLGALLIMSATEISANKKQHIQTLYDIVELSPKASPETIEDAYREFKQEVDKSDADPSDPTWQRVNEETLEAFSVLRDPEKRAFYDATL